LRYVSILELINKQDVTVSSVFAINQHWKEGHCFAMKKPRPTNALLWFSGCSGRYRLANGEQIEAPKGSIVYIPEGARYELTFYGCSAFPSTVLLEFSLSDGEHFALDGGIRIINTDPGDEQISSLLQKLVLEYSMPTPPALKLQRDVFGILALIGEIEEYKHLKRRGFSTIKKGIEYLNKDKAQELSIDEVAELCFVTPAYFRRLFKEYAGISPAEYRTRRKIERAKTLMEHTDVSVEEVSALLGYSDPSYFCRVFKKTVGITPSQYLKANKPVF